MKLKAAELIGIKASCVKLPRTTSQSELLAKIKELNESRDVHGIIVQMPLDSAEEIDAHKVTDAVDPDKDVDGLSTINEGKVATGDLTTGFLPCTPHGCLKLIEKSGVKVRDSVLPRISCSSLSDQRCKCSGPGTKQDRGDSHGRASQVAPRHSDGLSLKVMLQSLNISLTTLHPQDGQLVPAVSRR